MDILHNHNSSCSNNKFNNHLRYSWLVFINKIKQQSKNNICIYISISSCTNEKITIPSYSFLVTSRVLKGDEFFLFSEETIREFKIILSYCGIDKVQFPKSNSERGLKNVYTQKMSSH